MLFEIKSPILGFEHVKQMKLERIDDVFLKISNASDQENNIPSFTLINPFALREYEFEIPTSLELLLDLPNCKNMLIANIMVLSRPLEDSTINFLAPLLFNFDNRTMAQVVLDSIQYPQYSLAESFKLYCQPNKENMELKDFKPIRSKQS